MHQNKEFHLLSTPRYLGSPTGWARMQISCTSVSPTYPKLKLERPLPCNLDTPYPCSRRYFTIMLVVSSIHPNSRHFPARIPPAATSSPTSHRHSNPRTCTPIDMVNVGGVP